jgi:predicted transcriptional regulator
MARQETEGLTPIELEIMKVLWELGSASVSAVQQRLGRQSAYTTVQTMLNVLHRKGKVDRTLREKAYYYSPIVSRRQIAGQTIKDLINRLFDGSAENLVMNLVETDQITPEKLAQLNQFLNKETGGAGETKGNEEANDGDD